MRRATAALSALAALACGGLVGPDPQPVPADQQAFVGQWICEDGDRITIQSDGRCEVRRGNTVTSFVLDFSEGQPALREDFPVAGETLAVQQAPQLLEKRWCGRFADKECVRADPLPPEHQAWVGRWGIDPAVKLEDPTLSPAQRDAAAEATEILRIRADGWGRAVYDGGLLQGAVAVTQRGLEIGLCAAPILLAAKITAQAGDGPAQADLAGLPLHNIEPDFDAKDLSWQEPASGGDWDD